MNEVGVVLDQEETGLSFGFNEVEVGLELEDERVEVEEDFVIIGEEERRENIRHNIRELETLGCFGFSGVSDEIVKGLVEGEDISFI